MCYTRSASGNRVPPASGLDLCQRLGMRDANDCNDISR